MKKGGRSANWYEFLIEVLFLKLFLDHYCSQYQISYLKYPVAWSRFAQCTCVDKIVNTIIFSCFEVLFHSIYLLSSEHSGRQSAAVSLSRHRSKSSTLIWVNLPGNLNSPHVRMFDERFKCLREPHNRTEISMISRNS